MANFDSVPSTKREAKLVCFRGFTAMDEHPVFNITVYVYDMAAYRDAVVRLLDTKTVDYITISPVEVRQLDLFEDVV